ncbi:GNAT family N-acetyltransferase [Rhodobacteraceae bacterium RKSG542]|uniref:GNAT family N-acetyltransferase n=1 Tax=Pseudovibrio flavus TaxID=2529854 RepID=UPI0012BBFE9F|nr:GNAT family N-acetyltransferase [Pseudovibrio flavus]MTI18982.1 GNAT family N-acetyltransferase [Pseudovibrio flavus]
MTETASNSISLDLNGYTELPAGKVAFVVTHLRMDEKPFEAASKRDDLVLEDVSGNADVDEYLEMFRAVGSPWLWFGQLVKDRDALHAQLNAPETGLFYANRDGKRIGTLQLTFLENGEVEVMYFGLVPDAVGGGAGRWLMEQAIEIAFAREGTKCLMLHTCTGDSPQALGFYQKCGYKPYKRSIEVADDPRHSGILPMSAGPHMPLL